MTDSPRMLYARLAAVVLILLMASSASGIPAASGTPGNSILPGTSAVSVARPGAPSHGWIVAQSGPRWALVHVPPRESGFEGTRAALVASGGSVRMALTLSASPVAAAAAGDRVYLIFETRDRSDRVTRRDVSSMTAVRSGLGALWRFDPEGGLTALAMLPSEGTVVGFACLGQDPVVVLDDEGVANPSGPRIGVLYRGKWAWSPLEPAIAGAVRAAPGRVRVVSMRSGVGVLVAPVGGDFLLWTGTFHAGDFEARPAMVFDEEAPLFPATPSPGASREPRAAWTWNSRRLAVGPALAGDPARGMALECAGSLLWIQPLAEGRVEVYELSERVPARIASFDDVSLPIAVTSLESQGRVVMAWSRLDGGSAGSASFESSAAKRTHEAREFSASTGRVLYHGPARSLGPVTPNDLRVLSTALLITMGVALVLVLRPDPKDAVVTIPVGTALCEPVRRMLAAAIDGVLSWWMASTLLGLEFFQGLSPAAIIAGWAWPVSVTTLVVGMVIGTIGEWRTGRTPGKMIAGCEVVSSNTDTASGAMPRPDLLRALIRNAIKWLLPPVAMLGLFDHQGRHRADMMARTIVVIRIDAEPSE